MKDFKQVILIRQDLKLSKGKLAAQVAHASVEATLKSDKSIVTKWRNQGMKKVVLKVASTKDLIKYNQLAKDANIKTALIKDAGHTELKPGTTTCLGVGPDEEDKIDSITGKLQMA
jgi:peptidyl-tRNA hydrolase, PTH2 family